MPFRSVAAAFVAAAVFAPSFVSGAPLVERAAVRASAGRAAPAAATVAALVRSRIKYVFVLYQENRSFDSYFGTFPGAEGIYSHPAAQTPGFVQPLQNVDGSMTTVSPFRIGPPHFAADTDDVDHSHPRTVAKMDVANGVAHMDRFALVEEQKRLDPNGVPTLKAKQYGELAMAHEDCDTVPILWNYANRFTLFDHIFEQMTSPSTPGNLAIIGAQSGQTQWALHPGVAFAANGKSGPGFPMLNDADPFWGSPLDPNRTQPYNPNDFSFDTAATIQYNATFATLPLTLAGSTLGAQVATDRDPGHDLADVTDDVATIKNSGHASNSWGWYEEGYDRESTDPGPLTAGGTHASYITHHNGPQYFGYIANNPKMSAHLHGLGDFFGSVGAGALPANGGVFYVKGGYQNIFGDTPADTSAAVRKAFRGDDDHPAYSDSQISEALVAREINAIARSRYWNQSAIVLTWDDAEGDYDHVPPPIRNFGPNGELVSDGPRVPLLVISPFAKTHAIVHDQGDHGSVVKLVDAVFGLIPLAQLPDEKKGRKLGKTEFGLDGNGPDDDITPGVTDLLGAFDLDRLGGAKRPLDPYYAIVPDFYLAPKVQNSGHGCQDIGVTPTDLQAFSVNPVPADFNPRPNTEPTL